MLGRLLTELFNESAEWKWAVKANNAWIAAFDVDGTHMDVVFKKANKYNHDFIDVAFEQGDLPLTKEAKSGRKKFRPENVLIVLTTVVDIVRDYVKLNAPQMVRIAAEDATRGRIYTTLINKNKILGYNKIEIDGATPDEIFLIQSGKLYERGM